MIIDTSERKTTKEYRIQFKTARDDPFWLDHMLDGKYKTSILARLTARQYDRVNKKILDAVMPDRGYRIVETVTTINCSIAFTFKPEEVTQ